MGDTEGERSGTLADRLADAATANLIRAGVPTSAVPPRPTVKWERSTLEVAGLPLADGDDPTLALLAFLADVMGDDVGLADALDLDKMALSIMYGDDGRRLCWVKAPVDRRRMRPAAVRQAATEFVAEVSRRRPRKASRTSGDVDLIWPLSDLQLGKGPEQFGGLAATMRRVDWLLTEVYAAQARGRKVRNVFIPLVGDLTEGCLDSYPGQSYQVSLSVTEQFSAALGVVDRVVERALDVADDVHVQAVASNHDQASRRGKDNVTDAWDDRSFQITDTLALAYSKNPDRYDGRVHVTRPSEPQVGAFEVGPLVVAFTHGHKVGGSGPPVIKMSRWWDAQIASRQGAAAAAQVCIAAHYHHHYQLAQQGRLLVGLPALDGGSGWLREASGVWSAPGAVTMVVDDVGVQDVTLHTCPGDRERAADRLGVLLP